MLTGHESPFETLLGLVIAKSLNSVLVAQVSIFHRFYSICIRILQISCLVVALEAQCQYYTGVRAFILCQFALCISDANDFFE